MWEQLDNGAALASPAIGRDVLATGPGQGALDRYGDREKRLTYRPADRASQDLHCCGIDAWASLMPPLPVLRVFYVVFPPTGCFFVICLAQHAVGLVEVGVRVPAPGRRWGRRRETLSEAGLEIVDDLPEFTDLPSQVFQLVAHLAERILHPRDAGRQILKPCLMSVVSQHIDVRPYGCCPAQEASSPSPSR